MDKSDYSWKRGTSKYCTYGILLADSILSLLGAGVFVFKKCHE
nr:hypothetical protein [Clostridium sporogenes]